MAARREVLRDGHRLVGLLRTDCLSGSPFVVDVERDLSVPQQCFDGPSPAGVGFGLPAAGPTASKVCGHTTG